MDQGTSTILMIVVLFALMYFLMLRPENKRKKKAQEMGFTSCELEGDELLSM